MSDYLWDLLDAGFDEEVWNPSSPLPCPDGSYERHLLSRLQKDISDIKEVSIGNNCTNIIRRWEQISLERNYSDGWKPNFSQLQHVDVRLKNKELLDVILKLFWEKDYLRLGFVAEAMFLKYISQLDHRTTGCFHRLPSFGLYDLYESRSKTFIDIKHSMKSSYALTFRHLKKRIPVVAHSNYYIDFRKYNYAYLPTRIMELKGDIVKFEIRPLVSVEDAIKSFDKIYLKSAI